MLGYARVLAFLCAVLGPGQEEDLDRVLAELIEKTNELETLHLIYEMKGLEEATFEIVYSAPDRVYLRVSNEQGIFESWADSDQMTFAEPAGGSKTWRKVPIPKPCSAKVLLDERFPRSAPLGAGPMIRCEVGDNPEEGEGYLQVTAGYEPSRAHLLGWLGPREDSWELSNDGQSIVAKGEWYSWRISCSNGLLEHMSILSKAGETTDVRLREWYLDEPLDEDVLRLPEEARSAEVEPRMTSYFEQSVQPDKVRPVALRRVEQHLSEGRRTWDDGTREDWRVVMEALHRERIPTRIESFDSKARQWIERVAAIAKAQRGEGVDRTELAERVAEERERLEKELGTGPTVYQGWLPEVESEEFPPRQELLDVEAEVIEELWDELVVQPLLDTFDEVVGSQVDG